VWTRSLRSFQEIELQRTLVSFTIIRIGNNITCCRSDAISSSTEQLWCKPGSIVQKFKCSAGDLIKFNHWELLAAAVHWNGLFHT